MIGLPNCVVDLRIQGFVTRKRYRTLYSCIEVSPSPEMVFAALSIWRRLAEPGWAHLAFLKK
jgi:hypothetical protein